jgi:hypothetical protein
MIDDVYQAALAAIEHHLDQAGASYTLDDGEILFDGHRLGLAIAFDGLVVQGEHTLAPLDIQIHLDGDTGDRFRVGTLGVGRDGASAIQQAISEWHLLAVAPLLAALGAAVEKRRAGQGGQRLAGWDLFAGRVSIRGEVPPALRGGGTFYQALLEKLATVVSTWDTLNRWQLRSIYFMTTRGPEVSDLEAAIDGLIEPALAATLGEIPWPVGPQTYLYKQLFVLRHRPEA